MRLLEEFEGAKFRFRKQPVALPPDLRPAWRITVLLLVLTRCCRQGRSGLTRIHVLNWAMRTPQSRQLFLDVLEGAVRPDAAIVRFDPSLNRAIDVASGEKLLQRLSNKTFQITATGIALTEEVLADDTLMRTEKWFLGEVGHRATEKWIEKLLKVTA